MSKIHYFSIKFSKIFQRWDFLPPAPLNLRF